MIQFNCLCPYYTDNQMICNITLLTTHPLLRLLRFGRKEDSNKQRAVRAEYGCQGFYLSTHTRCNTIILASS